MRNRDLRTLRRQHDEARWLPTWTDDEPDDAFCALSEVDSASVDALDAVGVSDPHDAGGEPTEQVSHAR